MVRAQIPNIFQESKEMGTPDFECIVLCNGCVVYKTYMAMRFLQWALQLFLLQARSLHYCSLLKAARYLRKTCFNVPWFMCSASFNNPHKKKIWQCTLTSKSLTWNVNTWSSGCNALAFYVLYVYIHSIYPMSETAFPFIWLGNAIIFWIKIFFSECVYGTTCRSCPVFGPIFKPLLFSQFRLMTRLNLDEQAFKPPVSSSVTHLTRNRQKDLQYRDNDPPEYPFHWGMKMIYDQRI